MNFSAISHRCAFTDAYPLDENRVVINLRTGKDIKSVELIHDDPYAGGAMGRKLDFLLQEMNREANTIGSKCTDVKLARIVVDIKAELEKIREQTQNIE